ncbi:MAG: valine--tRNA ligase, partial [Pseudomonadota bacterium]
NEMPAGAIQVLVGQDVFGLPVADVINLADERARLEREKKKLDDEITKIDKKLANEKFLSQAPEKVVAEQRERKIDAEGKREKIAQSLSRLETLQAS